MPGHDGSHIHGHGSGPGLVAVIALVLIAAVAKPVRQAIVGHVLAVIAEVVIIGLAVLAAVAVAAGLAWSAARVYRRQAAWRPERDPAAFQARSEAVSPEPPQIETPQSWPDGLNLEIREEDWR